MIEIPLAPTSDFTSIDVRLEGTVFTLRTDWNARAGLWFLTLGIPAASGTVTLVSGLAMVASMPLNVGLSSTQWPGGALVILADRDPERDDWGTHARLYYLSRDEVFA